MPKKYASISFTPPQDVRAAARRGLALRRKFGRGGLDTKEAGAQGIGSGVQRATNLANGDTVSPETIGRMVSFFARHEKNKDSKTPSGEPGAGQIAWLLWGGDPGQRWAKKTKRQMEAADMKSKSLAQLANQIIALRSGRQGGVVSTPPMPFVPDEHLLSEYAEIRPEAIPHPLTYKSGGHTGAMIALFLPTSTGIHFIQSDPGALPPNELHVTLAYLGKSAELSHRQIIETHDLMKLISENHPPLTGHINGCGRFCNGDDDGDPFFIIPDLAALPNLRQIVIEGIRGRGINGASDHGFTPHITLTYLPHAEHNPFDSIEKTPVSFGAITLVLGDDRYDYPFADVSPLSKAALIEKIGARHTGAECALIQKMHDLTLDLGAECHPLTRRAGARHSHADQGLVQRMHDDCAGLGAVCKALPEKDGVYSSQILKDGEIEKGSGSSGNWGHTGRPGKKGGSQGGGGFGRIGLKNRDRGNVGKIRKLAKGHKKSILRSNNGKKLLNKVKHGGTLKLTADGLDVDVSIKSGGGVMGMAVKEPGKKKFGKHFIRSSNDIENYLGQFEERPAPKPKKAKKKAPAAKKDLTKMSKGELNAGFLNAKNHKERTSFAEELLKDFGDNTVAKSKKDIPKLKDRIQPASKEIADKGKNAIFRSPGGAMGLGKVLQGASGKFWNGNFGKIEEVIPVFKADLTTRAQSDAPNYRPASTPQRCANCRFFLGDPGRDWCDLFDFTADPDYHCDDWEAQRPDEIPGYVANKGDLAALTEGILTLRGGRTSGNWGHVGRKGKRGGSGGGGGFKRIGVKPGSKPSRKKVMAAAKKKAKSPSKPKVQAKPRATKKPDAKPAVKPVAAKKTAAKKNLTKSGPKNVGDLKNAKSISGKEMTDSYREWNDGLSKKEFDAVAKYQAAGHFEMNGHLRSGKPNNKKVRSDVANLDAAMSKTSVPRDLVVHRGTDPNVYKNELGPDPSTWVGKTFTDKGFMSTTVDPEQAFGGTESEIRVPKGSKGSWLGDLKGREQLNVEQELLLPRNTKLRIVGVTVDKSGEATKIITEVIP